MASGVAQIVALVCLTGSARGDRSPAHESEFGNDHPTILVENIRRQLMNENYDYLPTESEEAFPIKHELGSERAADPPPPAAPARVPLDSDINDQFLQPKNHELETEHIDDFENNSHAISKKDLLYYVNDDTLKQEATKTEDEVNDDPTVVEPTSPKVKYKVLKVKQANANRRSQSFRRFIQEEGEEGVAIINLDDEPFPEFRLPRARRQYMMDGDDLDSEIEIAPPSEPDAEAPGAVFDQIHRVDR